MATTKPVVLEAVSLTDFVRYVLDNHTTPSTLIVCSSKEAFLEQLQASITSDVNANGGGHEASDEQPEHPVQQRAWNIPTLRLLASSRTVKVVFCPDVAHFRAYLASHAHRVTKQTDLEPSIEPTKEETRLLALLNPIELHRPTSAFSAQGINRTLATAVDAAHQTGSQLILAECSRQADTGPLEDTSTSGGDPASWTTNPWDEEVSILNVTTKSFGAGERGWVGRTVRVRTIAERWCVFHNMGSTGK